MASYGINMNKRGFTHPRRVDGFSLIEMIVVVSIFAIMAGIGMFNYQEFVERIELDELAYDIALTIKQAQTYGISAVEYGSLSSASSENSQAVGVFFDKGSGSIFGNQFSVFRTGNTSHDYYDDSIDTLIDEVTVSGGAYISTICLIWISLPAGGINCLDSSADSVSISFKRPDPESIITLHDGSSTVWTQRILIELSNASATSTANIIIEPTGRILVES